MNSSKLIFVTGAGRGIGQAIALRLAAEQFTVAGCARSIDQLAETRRLSHNKILVRQVDVTDAEGLSRWMSETEIETGAKPWGLVTAAGVYGPIGNFLDNNWQKWREGIEINLFGTVLAIHAFASRLKQLESPGRIVLLSGGGATQPLPCFTNYCAGKAAVVRFGETVAQELKEYGITVNSVAPGAVNTQILEDLLEAGPEKAGKEMYQKALKQKETGGTSPEKAANLVSYLMSETSQLITGKLISAVWDPWTTLHEKHDQLNTSDVYTLRRIVPTDRGLEF